MEDDAKYPQQHDNLVKERISEWFFRRLIPVAWIVDKPEDYGIDLIVSPVLNGKVVGLNFSVQLKSTKDAKGKLETRLKKSTLNYLFNRLEPAMVVLYDDAAKQGYWKWLLAADFDLSLDQDSYAVKFDAGQNLHSINWDEVCSYVQRIFKVKNRLLTSLEYDLFNTASEAEAKAWSHYFTRNFAEAAFYFKRLLQQEEVNTVWWVALAQCQYEEYDYRNALININKAAELDTADNILFTKGCILAEDGIRNKDKLKIIEADKLFEQLFARNPSDTHAYNYANTLSRLGRPEQAIAMYRHALERNPNYAEAWKNLGQVYYDLKEHAQEMECYDKALRINPALLPARISRAITDGFVYKHYEASIDTIRECLAASDLITAEFPSAYYYLGLFLHRVGKTTDALAWITKGLDNHPRNNWLRGLKANLLYELVTGGGKEWINEAKTFFTDNYQANSNDGVNFYYLCSVVARNGEEAKAKEMAFGWLQEQVFPGSTKAVSAVELDFEQLLDIIKNYEVIKRYLVSNPISKIRAEIEYSGIEDSEDLLRVFHLKRAIFLAKVAAGLEWSKEKLAGEMETLYRATFLTIDSGVIGKLIKAKEQDTENFAIEVANVGSTLSTMCMREAIRCVGYAVGYFDQEKDSILSKNQITPALLTESMCYFSAQIDRYFHRGD
jgi:tetratricopeptide (TPR) repeat protein